MWTARFTNARTGKPEMVLYADSEHELQIKIPIFHALLTAQCTFEINPPAAKKTAKTPRT